MRRYCVLSALLLLGSAPVPTAMPVTLSFSLIREPSIRVLMFHQVTNHPIEPKQGPGGPWISPKRFAALLHALSTHGYHFITMHTALAFLTGKLHAAGLPTKPVTLTFDDGYRSAWTEATPIVRRFGASATMFFEGHATGVIPGRLTDADLRAMARSGIWSLQSHGFAGHSDLLVGPHGHLSPYWYANLAWLPKLHRFETKREFEERVEGDLKRFRTTFQPVTGAPITLFAYPSGEYGQNAALPSAANPATNSQAGHSNARGLTPEIFRALANAGFKAAFSVYDPGHIHFAQRGDNPYALPRMGFSSKSTVASDMKTMRALETKGIEFPEIADGNYTAVGPIATYGKCLFAASTTEPLIYRLDMNGRKIATYRLPSLEDGRANAPSAIGGLAVEGSTLWVAQKAGFGAHPTPYLSAFAIEPSALRPLSRVALPHTMDWLAGLASLNKTLYGIDDGGELFDVQSGKKIASLAHGATYESNRYAGLTASGGLLYTFDSVKHRVTAFEQDGTLMQMGRIEGDLRSVALHGDHLYASDWSTARHTLRIFVMRIEKR